MPADPSELRDFAARYTDAWCSQDAASVAAFFAANGSLRINDGAPAVGRTAIAEVAQSFMVAFPDLRIVMDDLSIQDDQVIYHWTLTGNNTGPGGTGQPVRISGSETWQIDSDELIASSQGRFDSAEYNRQLDPRSHKPR
ncbi:nuclear transport factor 2 family protein [Tunturiibacter gelidoferens]|uniref:Steroid delta-isomerase-like uncharacterized protein n=2 Tax=Tunturiibacter TaxID=3154218 RepID=A0A7Y9NJE1_9BACT|nr:nuclear transport factor 2 family protein [Edaphobacter lichenicola]MBB5340355.1 steroid delta-isomerase-like uncharacterized protein [Edaphobacter lichenicola]NYF50332.1 steroid delta-isomerase-like uncharacterized protein [Edaphobacter lichenicola]